MTFYDLDVGQTLQFLLRLNGAIANLTGGTVALLVNFGDGNPTVFPCTVPSPATAGIAERVVAAVDFAGRPGRYTGQVRVTYPTLTLHSPPFGLIAKRLFT